MRSLKLRGTPSIRGFARAGQAALSCSWFESRYPSHIFLITTRRTSDLLVAFSPPSALAPEEVFVSATVASGGSVRFIPFALLGYCCGILAIVADMDVDQSRLLSVASTVPEVMVMRLPGFAAESVVLALVVCAVLYIVDRVCSVSSSRALSTAAACCGILSWSPFVLQMSFIAGEVDPPDFRPTFEFYGSIAAVLVLVAAVDDSSTCPPIRGRLRATSAPDPLTRADSPVT